MLKQVKRQPTTGTFVAVWEYEGEVYCNRFIHIGNSLCLVEYRANGKEKYSTFPCDWNRLLRKVKYFVTITE